MHTPFNLQFSVYWHRKAENNPIWEDENNKCLAFLFEKWQLIIKIDRLTNPKLTNCQSSIFCTVRNCFLELSTDVKRILPFLTQEQCFHWPSGKILCQGHRHWSVYYQKEQPDYTKWLTVVQMWLPRATGQPLLSKLEGPNTISSNYMPKLTILLRIGGFNGTDNTGVNQFWSHYKTGKWRQLDS